MLGAVAALACCGDQADHDDERADKNSFAPFVERLTAGSDDTIVGLQTGIVVERGQRTGTGVIVVNWNQMGSVGTCGLVVLVDKHDARLVC